MDGSSFQQFTSTFGLVFVLTLEKKFSYRFHFQANRESIGFLKNGTRDFQNSPPFEKSTCFYVTISENFEHLQSFDFEKGFLENDSFFQKTGVPFFSWTNERTKIEKTSFPYKTAVSEANFKTKRMVTTKWTYHRERSFASNYLIFMKVLFQFKNLL